MSEEKKLSTIVDVRDWLKEQEVLTRQQPLSLGQFAIDWIEEEVDRAEQYLESAEITVDDVTFVGAIHYRADNVIDIMRTDAPCYQFFTELARLTK